MITYEKLIGDQGEFIPYSPQYRTNTDVLRSAMLFVSGDRPDPRFLVHKSNLTDPWSKNPAIPEIDLRYTQQIRRLPPVESLKEAILNPKSGVRGRILLNLSEDDISDIFHLNRWKLTGVGTGIILVPTLVGLSPTAVDVVTNPSFAFMTLDDLQIERKNRTLAAEDGGHDRKPDHTLDLVLKEIGNPENVTRWE